MGAKIVSINPLVERGLERFAHPQEPLALLGQATQLTDLYLQVRINGDLALLKGLCKAVLEHAEHDDQCLDKAFIEEYTSGYEAFVQDVRQESWPRIEESSGLSQETIREAAQIYRDDAIIACWAMGLTQHENAVETIQYVVNLLARGTETWSRTMPGRGTLCPGRSSMGIWKRLEAFLERLVENLNYASKAWCMRC